MLWDENKWRYLQLNILIAQIKTFKMYLSKVDKFKGQQKLEGCSRAAQELNQILEVKINFSSPSISFKQATSKSYL